MARILCVTNGLPGLLYTSLELSRRLAAAGHQMTYASFPEARGVVEDHGFEFLELVPSRYDAFLEADARNGLIRRLGSLDDRRTRAMESTGVASFVRAVRELSPDLMLIDLELHEHIVAASATRVPMALLNTFVSIWRQPGVPPPHRLVRPGVGWRGARIVTALLWWELRLRKLRRASWHRLTRVGCDRLSILDRLARDSGFDMGRETDASQWPIPLTYRRLPVLTLHALEFEFRRDVPRRVHYVGPMVSAERVDRRSTPHDAAAIDEILERRRVQGRKRPLIYAGFGSFFSTDVGFLRRLIAGLAGGEWEVLISLGGQLDRSALGPLPVGIHAFPWVPQVRVLQDADLSISHGAITTADECVVCGVPTLAYCGHQTDMPGTTARLVHHGLGAAGDRARDTPTVIRGRVERLLSDRRIQDNVRRFQALYAKYAEERVAERVVESLLGSTPGPRS
jgi:UDP:flavonoid glycosyltransferase YjiC (YdhE family)